MKNRINNPNDNEYANYGGRGIRICEDWSNKENGVVNFYNWSLDHGYSDELTIDRIDVNGNYSPDNCRWATELEQACNKRNNIFAEINGEMKHLSQIARDHNISQSTISRRYAKGLRGEELIKPSRKPRKKPPEQKWIYWEEEQNRFRVQIKGKYISVTKTLNEALEIKYNYLKGIYENGGTK